MPEEPKSETSILEWFHTKTGLCVVGAVSLLALGIGAWLKEIIPIEVALPLAGFLLILVPMLLFGGARASSRQRAKIEALEAKILSLERPPSVELPKQYSDEHHAMLVKMASSNTRSWNIRDQGTLATMEALERDGLVTKRIKEYDAIWWDISEAGRKYLKESNVI